MASRAVLVVDDNNVVRSALRNFLERNAELVVSEAADGTEAVKIAEQLMPELVIMDLVMPNLGGLEAASVIRGLLPKARIIIFTLYSGDFGQALLRAAGVDLVVDKVEGAAGLMRGLQKVLPDGASRNVN